MSEQIKDQKEVRGSLARVYCAHYGNCLILVFGDGRWAHYMSYDDGDGDRHIEFETDQPDLEELLHAGLLSQDAYLARRADESAARAESQREMELAALARLKAKYEAAP